MHYTKHRMTGLHLGHQYGKICPTKPENGWGNKLSVDMKKQIKCYNVHVYYGILYKFFTCSVYIYMCGHFCEHN